MGPALQLRPGEWILVVLVGIKVAQLKWDGQIWSCRHTPPTSLFLIQQLDAGLLSTASRCWGQIQGICFTCTRNMVSKCPPKKTKGLSSSKLLVARHGHSDCLTSDTGTCSEREGTRALGFCAPSPIILMCALLLFFPSC